MKKDDRDKRVEETLKFSSSGTMQTDLEAILGFWSDLESTFLQKDFLGFQIHDFTFAIYVWKSWLLYSVNSTQLI